MPTQPALGWLQRDIPELGLSVAFLSSAAIDESTEDDFRSLVQVAPPIQLGVYWGPGATLDGWAREIAADPRVQLGPRRAIRVCGHEATAQDAVTPEGGTAVGYVAQPGRPPSHVTREYPSMTVKVIAFERTNVPVLVSWRCETRHASESAAAEHQFLRSVACR